jgi:preflagellin peptidase FlaK
MLIDILKILFCTPFLLYSCYSDIKTRRVSDKVWMIMLAGVIFFVLFDYFTYGLIYIPRLLISASLTYAFLYLLDIISTFLHFRMLGGADAKLLLILSIIFPVYPTLQDHVFPFHIPLNFFAFSVLGDSIILAMIIPIGFALYNLKKMGLHVDNPVYIFLGYKTKISELVVKHIWISQDFEEINGKINIRYKRGGIEVDDKIIAKLKKLVDKGLIKDEVWVTPKVPFMIPLTVGFFVAIFYGDLIFEFTKYILFKI